VAEASAPSVGVSYWVSVPLSVPVASAAGTEYALVVYAPFGDCGADCWHWWGGTDSPYAGGEALFAIDGVSWVPNAADLDFSFRTHVVPRPLPSSKEECKDDGWRTFEFKNQGDCISFVERAAANT
jgi:hypothetical protein